jgi:DNA-binding transcriptional MocR family regulator
MAKFSGTFIPIPTWVMEYLGSDPIALCVLVNAIRYMDNDTQQFTTSYDHLAEKTGLGRSTIIRAMQRIESSGVLRKTVRKAKGGNNRPNLYTVDFNNPKSREGVTSDTPGSVTSDTPLVSPATPSEGVTPDTQSIETNHLLEGKPKEKKKIPSFMLTDPKWKKQIEKWVTE